MSAALKAEQASWHPERRVAVDARRLRRIVDVLLLALFLVCRSRHLRLE